MAIRQVKWTSTTLLTCAGCATPENEVILCVTPELVAPKACPEQEEDQPFEYSTIEASIVRFCQTSQIDPPSWTYVFSYDDDQLVEDAVLSPPDILGAFCKGCLASWVEELVGNEVYIREDEGGNVLVTQHGCEYPLATPVDPPEPQEPLLVEDTPSVDLTINPDIPQTLSADVKLSDDEGNQIEERVDGLYVPEPPEGGESGSPCYIFGDGSDGDLTVLNGEDILIPFPARNYHFENLTIDAGGTFRPYGYFVDNLTGDFRDREYYCIYVNGTLTINGSVSADGADGTNGSGSSHNHGSSNGVCIGIKGAFGGPGGAGDGPGGGDDTGGCGGTGQSDSTSATDGDASQRQRGYGAGYMAGGLGGVSGAGGGGGGAGYTPNIPDDGDFYKPTTLRNELFSFSSGGSYIANAIGGGAGGAGGGGGTRTGTAQGGEGGGGGASGGSIFIAARNVVIGATGSITANGGNGGNGAAATASGGNAASGGGAGSGGGGGLVYLVYESLTNAGAITVDGGAGATGGAGVDGGSAGADSTAGNDGNIYLFDVSECAITGGGGGDDWHITGNTGTVDGTNFIGTLDDVAHDVRVNNTRVRRSIPDVVCNIIVDGDATNAADGAGCTIGGGGDEGFGPNVITNGFFSTIGGGASNEITDDYDPRAPALFFNTGFSTISGGAYNVFEAIQWPELIDPGAVTIGGGKFNLIVGGDNSTIGGGYINYIQYDPNSTTEYAYCDTIAGGNVNQIYGIDGLGPDPGVLGDNFIGGGETNEIDNGVASTICGGKDNIMIFDDLDVSRGPNSYNFIGGGFVNEIHDCARGIILGGGSNQVFGNDSSAILSGFLNFIECTTPVAPVSYGIAGSLFDPPDSDGVGNVIVGGEANRIFDGRCSTILGGAFLQIGENSFGFQSAGTRDFTEIAGTSGGHGVDGEPVQVDVSAFTDIGYFGDIDLWIGNTDNTARKVKFFEPNTDTDFSSANYSSFEAQAQAGDIEYILPVAAGIAGDALRIQSVLGSVVTLEWG